ncbi:cyclin-dependent kinase 4 inhibitor D [Embiotoca jacksoni]|uniref:cyclin-dependent kinase 4 inhibitor D n=1 Tax=Embiotoca jacksoni TaxID=100190 RepID=UPI0037049934
MFVNSGTVETSLYRSHRANVFCNVDKLFSFGFYLKISGLNRRLENLGDALDPNEPEQDLTIMVLSQMDAGKALTAAAAKGDSSEVRRILEECRVHPDTLNEFGRTALQVMMMGNSKIASLLLEKGADPNVQDSHGIAPVHDAARTGFLDTLQVLVEYGASVNIPDHSGTLPIHIAIRGGHRDVVKFLAPRSDLKHANISGQTAIDVARASCVPDMIDSLFAHIHS